MHLILAVYALFLFWTLPLLLLPLNRRELSMLDKLNHLCLHIYPILLCALLLLLCASVLSLTIRLLVIL